MNDPNARRTALVTGAARGIGRAVVRRLLDEGFVVWSCDTDKTALQSMQAALPETLRSRIEGVVADVGDEQAVHRVVTRLRATTDRLDLLVNNAGIADPFNGPIEELALADWERVLRTNLTGCFLLAKHATPLLRAARGCIVNMTSSRAFQSEPQTEAYAASKDGIHALTHALAVSLGPDIRVNAIAPGWIDVRAEQPETPAPGPLRDVDHAQHPGGRVGQGADIAGIVVFLAGADAAFITGQTLVADGGMTRRMIYAH